MLRSADQEHVLVLTFHHIIYDGWSEQVFRDELLRAYAAFVEGMSPELPELPIQYADYACWQRELLEGPRFDEQLAFWRERLAELPSLALPIDRPQLRRETFSGANEPIEWPSRLTGP